MAAVLRTVQQAQLGPGQRWYRRLRRAAGSHRLRVWSALSVLAAAALAVPVPHRVECDCAIEPVVRQFIAAPFGAPLEASLVRPGDEIAEGQLLARLDGREVRWELAGVEADFQRAARERDGHMAQHDSGAARLSELQMERLQLQTKLLEHRAEQLEIRSPLAGLVISGDLDQAIGAPLEIGQVLFELAPLERVVVELKIPEQDVPYAQVGQPVRFWLESQPDEPRDGRIARITPRAEIVDGMSVFVAEVPFENHAAWLRPGMQGTARIDVGECRLGWRLFHRAWETARVWFGV
jgi:multidrug efflux pump subunit AcrA (membrane-fusion protein)